jgi:hypothetical protein
VRNAVPFDSAKEMVRNFLRNVEMEKMSVRLEEQEGDEDKSSDSDKDESEEKQPP